MRVEKPLIELRLINQSRLTPHGGHWRIVWMRGKFYAHLFRDGKHFGQKIVEALPYFIVCDRGNRSVRRIRIIDHVPDHAIGQRRIQWPIHAYGNRATACETAGDAAANASDAEVVTDNWYA